jgi:hypothetical protein
MARWLTQLPQVRVTPGTTYSSTAYMKTQGVAGGFAQLVVTFWDASGAYIGSSAVGCPIHLTGDTDWSEQNVSARAPDGAASMRLEFRLNGPGTLWTDDISVSS